MTAAKTPRVPKKPQFKAVLRYYYPPELKGFDMGLSKTGDQFANTPCYLIPADAASYEAQVEAMAKACDPTAFHTYKPGDVLPRGHELSPLDKVNNIQEWRKRDALSRARKSLAAIDIHRPTKGRSQ